MPECYMEIVGNFGVYHPKTRSLYLIDTGATAKRKTFKRFASPDELTKEEREACAIRIEKDVGARAIMIRTLTPIAILNRLVQV